MTIELLRSYLGWDTACGEALDRYEYIMLEFGRVQGLCSTQLRRNGIWILEFVFLAIVSFLIATHHVLP